MAKAAPQPKKAKSKARKKLSGAALAKAASRVKVLILDIDGVLTDCKIYYSEAGGFSAAYSVLDGFGIKLLLRNGIEVCFLSAGTFLSHKKRAEVLGIRHAYFGDENKLASFEKICRDLAVKPEECAYMADELFDIPVLEKVGLSVCPPHSTKKVLDLVHYITKKPGGNGAVREITDLMLRSRGIDV